MYQYFIELPDRNNLNNSKIKKLEESFDIRVHDIIIIFDKTYTDRNNPHKLFYNATGITDGINDYNKYLVVSERHLSDHDKTIISLRFGRISVCVNTCAYNNVTYTPSHADAINAYNIYVEFFQKTPSC